MKSTIRIVIIPAKIPTIVHLAQVLGVKVQVIIRFLFNLLDNHSIDRITERKTITRYTTFILGNLHGGENPAKTSLI
jgi:hypothetical protein